jgi:hypothetical protein
VSLSFSSFFFLPTLETVQIVENIREQKVQQRPQLSEIVLEWCSFKSEVRRAKRMKGGGRNVKERERGRGRQDLTTRGGWHCGTFSIAESACSSDS